MASSQRLPPSIDIMNDPAYAPRKSAGGGSSESDHCRICRSEGTPNEPLYHPCKCSGSIKFVHQDCLMEWLQHSQKKYCELCKTPFRFTKLYDPTMPKTLPLPLFLSRASKHLGRTVLLWLRFLLVCFVWLGILPWSVRWMWRFWFWLGDGGWAWWRRPYQVYQGPMMQNTTAIDKPANLSSFNNRSDGSEPTIVLSTQWSTSISFGNMTRSGLLNKMILDTFEGQILTALIIVTFVMIFLIREWVVQQQPNLAIADDNIPQAEAIAGMLGADDHDDDDDDLEDEEEEEEEEEEELDNLFPDEILDNAYGRLEENANDGANDIPHLRQGPPQPRVFAPLRRRRVFGAQRGNDQLNTNRFNVRAAEQSNVMAGRASASGAATGAGVEQGHPRRPILNREIIAQAAELRRQMEGQVIETNPFHRLRPSPLRNEVIEESSEWEDEEEEGGVALEMPQSGGHSNKGKSIAQVNTFEDNGDSVQNQPLFEKHPDTPNVFMRKNSPPLETSTPLIFGQSKPAHYFGQWDMAQKPLFAQEPNTSQGSEQVNEFLKADTEISQTNSQSEIWSNKNNENSNASSLPVSNKDKGKGVNLAEELDESDWDEDTMELDYLSDEFSTLLDSGNSDTVIQDEDVENLGFTTAELEEANVLNDINAGHNDPIPALEVQPRPEAAALPILPRPARRQPRGNRWFDLIVGEIPQERDEVPAAAEEALRNADQVGPGNAIRENNDGVVAPVDVDDADDFDGIMELIGMRGPLLGLAQNASICIFLITASIMLAVAVPYVWGRILLTILAHPLLFTVVLPWATAMFCANLAIDSVIYLSCTVLYEVDYILRFILRIMSFLTPSLMPIAKSTRISNILYACANGGWQRVLSNLTQMAIAFRFDKPRTTIQGFPPSQRESTVWLANRQPWARATLAVSWLTEKLAASVNLTSNASQHLQELSEKNKTTSEALHAAMEKLVHIWTQPTSRQLNHTFVNPLISETEAVFVELSNAASWTAADRVIAVAAGYALFTMVGAWYLSKYKSQPGTYRRHLEKASVELLQQAGGVMKVILIIGIEMFVFPLYCGVLLDVALLPLFENATILSRIQFTVDHLFTSTFVHWFVGTCYMFHFALFVSMCRKIMRPGVLYFIRDPDDPNTHPVKDVLERPVMLQLRKIAFSAFIYGFLVLFCLGGVVWWLHHAFENVLPIHWSSNEPVLEFPVDLLFYNFFMPVAVQFFKPSEALQKMYGWWFRQCARLFRLTSFMFGDRRPEEEGRVVRNTWAARILLKQSDPTDSVVLTQDKRDVDLSHRETYFLRDGRFVRAPASDSVRRPKGEPVFIPVNEKNERIDGQPDPEDGETGPNSTDFKLVYIPPRFKTRIALVVISIWLFAAVTGVSVTIGPLLLGRKILKSILPEGRRMNDVYAFSIGIYIVGGMGYLFTKVALVKNWLKNIRVRTTSPMRVRRSIASYGYRAIKLFYILAAFVVVLPTLFALMIEFYLIIPTHTYFFSGEAHVIHFVQDWTLGVLYIKMLGNMLLLDPDSPWARALRGVVARGYLDPDVKLATRCFILPATLLMVAALLLPLGLGYLASKTILREAEPAVVALAYRYSFPAVFILMVLMSTAYFLKRIVDKWKQNVRDEVYLIGERLHNHGERSPAHFETVAGAAYRGPEVDGSLPGPAVAQQVDP